MTENDISSVLVIRMANQSGQLAPLANLLVENDIAIWGTMLGNCADDYGLFYFYPDNPGQTKQLLKDHGYKFEDYEIAQSNRPMPESRSLAEWSRGLANENKSITCLLGTPRLPPKTVICVGVNEDQHDVALQKVHTTYPDTTNFSAPEDRVIDLISIHLPSQQPALAVLFEDLAEFGIAFQTLNLVWCKGSNFRQLDIMPLENKTQPLLKALKKGRQSLEIDVQKVIKVRYAKESGLRGIAEIQEIANFFTRQDISMTTIVPRPDKPVEQNLRYSVTSI